MRQALDLDCGGQIFGTDTLAVGGPALTGSSFVNRSMSLASAMAHTPGVAP